MKKINNKIVALAIAGFLMLSGCEVVRDTSTALGSTGTGVLAGAGGGAAVGAICNEATGGKNKTECIAAGLVVGAAAGVLAASIDEEVEKSVPAMDCASVKRRMKYPSTATKPKASLRITLQSPILKIGEKSKTPMKMDLAMPDKMNELPLIFDVTMDSENKKTKTITKTCGGDYPIQLPLPTDKEGVYNTTIKLLNASDKSLIEGGMATFCYTVANDGVNKCGRTPNRY